MKSSILFTLVVTLLVGCSKELTHQETRMYKCAVSPSQITESTGHVCAAGTPTSDEAAALVLVQSETASDEFTPVIHNHLGNAKFYLVKGGTYEQMTAWSANGIDVESGKTTRDTLPIVKSGDRLLWIACEYGYYDFRGCLEPVEVTVGNTNGDYPEGHSRLVTDVLPRRRACVSVPGIQICYDYFEQYWHVLSQDSGVVKANNEEIEFSAGDDILKEDADASAGKKFDFRVYFGNVVTNHDYVVGQADQHRVPSVEIFCTLGEKQFNCGENDVWGRAAIELESFGGVSGSIETQYHLLGGTKIETRNDSNALWLENSSEDSLKVIVYAMEVSDSTEMYRIANTIVEADTFSTGYRNLFLTVKFEQNSVYCVRIINFTKDKYQDEFFKVDYLAHGNKVPLVNSQISGQCL